MHCSCRPELVCFSLHLGVSQSLNLAVSRHVSSCLARADLYCFVVYEPLRSLRFVSFL